MSATLLAASFFHFHFSFILVVASGYRLPEKTHRGANINGCLRGEKQLGVDSDILFIGNPIFKDLDGEVYPFWIGRGSWGVLSQQNSSVLIFQESTLLLSRQCG